MGGELVKIKEGRRNEERRSRRSEGRLTSGREGVGYVKVREVRTNEGRGSEELDGKLGGRGVRGN